MRSKIQPKKKSATKAPTTKKRTTGAAKATPKKPASKNDAKPAAKKLSAMDAAAKVLTAAQTPMSTQEMIEAMAAKGLWQSPGGKTPHATLYAAILREINTKGKDARFKKTERGKFALAGRA